MMIITWFLSSVSAIVLTEGPPSKISHRQPEFRPAEVREIHLPKFVRFCSLKHREIQAILAVSSGFISKWTQQYESGGVSSLKLGHRGSSGYLTAAQRTSVMTWIKAQNYWHLPELQAHLADEYDVVFKSKQSYYDLLTEAGMSWKKSQKRNPKTDPELVKKN